MKKLCLLLLLLGMAFSAFAAGIDDLIFAEPAPADSADIYASDIIKVNFEKKDARLAMLFSSLLPGAGQFYAKKSALTAYIFPVLEAAMIGGIVYYNSQGAKKEKAFEKFANGETITQTFSYTIDDSVYTHTYTGPRYNRDFQHTVEQILIDMNAFDIYDGTLFRLDSENSQHFYEDIGKYNKYTFGWADWFFSFASNPTLGSGVTDPDSLCILDQPAFAELWATEGDGTEFRWLQNYNVAEFIDNEYDIDGLEPISPGYRDASPMRQQYIKLRNDSKDQYATARLFTLGLVANHLVSAVDAALLTNRINREALTQSPLQMYYYTDFRGNQLTPTLGLTYSF